ncbi:sensor protein KdpD [Oxobacter pfennigii]|uniref:histidine kinase n=1 Tax=Oxobacter pfennigii TaxID=36849 RepID=A0A0P8W9G2_9CLOT|nr:ATP-binding protein [Oxobacter pfennigii]KPU44324.1 sensor protein KdpD [Oxobacter pfennigii]
MNYISKFIVKYRIFKNQSISIKIIFARTGIMLAFLFGASAIGYIFHVMSLPEADIAIVYLLAVLLTARFIDGYFFGFWSSLLAAFFFNFLFMEPYYAFSVNTHSYIITFIVMLITALITSTLTTHARQNAIKAQEHEAEMKALYTLTNRLTDAADIHDIASTAIRTISDMLGSNVGCLCFDENGKPENTFIQQCSPAKQIWREISDPEEFRLRIEGLRTGCHKGGEFYDWPVYGKETTLGVIRISKEAAKMMNRTQVRMLHAMIESTALAMDRFRAAQQRQKINEAIVQERYRGNLLRAISHDLRTPLAGIMGTAEMLLNMTVQDERQYNLIKGIYRDADWLHSLVENILSLTRVQDGKLVLHKQQEAAEEVVGAAILHISRLHPEHEISVTVPDELLLVPMDAKLIRQVLINLLDNAVKHTAPQDEISVSVKKDNKENYAVFSVCDNGEGIETADIPNIFEMFYTSKTRRSDAQRGVGLGLTICDAIVKAHGGGIKANNRPGSPGAEFIFTLPLEGNDHELQ